MIQYVSNAFKDYAGAIERTAQERKAKRAGIYPTVNDDIAAIVIYVPRRQRN